MAEHTKGLWAVFWRMALLTPIALVGMVAFVAMLLLTWVLPLCGIFAVVESRYILASLSLVLWIFWLRFGGPVRRACFEGFEHGSL